MSDRHRRELRTAVLLVLLGAVLLLASTAGDWVTGVDRQPEPLPLRDVAASASDVASPVRALGLVVLAGVPALLATRGRGRTVLGALLVLAGAAAGAAAAGVLSDPAAALPAGTSDVDTTFRPWLAVGGAVVTALAGALVTGRGHRWATMSARYDAPAAGASPDRSPGAEPLPDGRDRPAPAEDPSLWEAFDRGEDPTRG